MVAIVQPRKQGRNGEMQECYRDWYNPPAEALGARDDYQDYHEH